MGPLWKLCYAMFVQWVYSTPSPNIHTRLSPYAQMCLQVRIFCRIMLTWAHSHLGPLYIYTHEQVLIIYTQEQVLTHVLLRKGIQVQDSHLHAAYGQNVQGFIYIYRFISYSRVLPQL